MRRRPTKPSETVFLQRKENTSLKKQASTPVRKVS